MDNELFVNVDLMEFFVALLLFFGEKKKGYRIPNSSHFIYINR